MTAARDLDPTTLEWCAKQCDAEPGEKPHHRYSHWVDRHAGEVTSSLAAKFRAQAARSARLKK